MPEQTVDSPKANFIRGLDVGVKTGEVIKRAKAAGLSVSPTYVRNIRIAMAEKAPAGVTPAKKAAQKGPAAGGKAPQMRPSPKELAPTTPKPQAGSKRAFVLSFPPTTPARDVLAAGAVKGIALTQGYVYWLRSDAARGGRDRGAKKSAGAKQRTTTVPREVTTVKAQSPAMPAASASASSRDHGMTAERLILDTALRVVGIERAIAVLEAARGRLDRLLDA